MVTKIAITGAAGLVGQNLIPALKQTGQYSVVALDRHEPNMDILRSLHPEVQCIVADLAEPGGWQDEIADCELAVQLHAQIGGLSASEFERNNIEATNLVLQALEQGACEYLVHISSSVVNSAAVDNYTETKKAQEALVERCTLPHITLRPTLMFGWFDRKHVGWLQRFMQRAPVFPIPGSGKYLRQPLYAGDFSAIIHAALENRMVGAYNISGQERIDYIDLIREVRGASNLKTPIVKIPYSLFWALLSTYALFDRDPPFTTKQLEALVTPDIFEVIDWPSIFDIQQTDLSDALHQTFNHPTYSEVVLDF
ncbi:MAG: NAD(P)-dependent oxidoreductase [Pseudomonadota bacterium]